jgi:HPt (histidine-containing phosphotransfer) domain-containing protein
MRLTTDNLVVSFSDTGNQPGPSGGERDASRYASFGLAMLLDLFEDDRDTIVDLLSAALASIERDTDAILRSAPADDRHTIVEAAHRIKGTSGSIGARALIEISSRIEAVAARSSALVGEDTLAELLASVAAVRADIADYTFAE